MNRKNIAIIVVVIVVIVVIAAASYWYYGGDDEEGDGSAYMRSAVVGDIYVYEAWTADGEVGWHSTFTIVGEDSDGNQLVRVEYSDDRPDYHYWADGNFWIEDDLYSYELVGQCTFDSPMYNEVVCDVYYVAEFDVYWIYLEGTEAYVGEAWAVDDGYRVDLLVESSTFGDAPVYDTSSTMADTVSVGDFYLYDIDVYDGNGDPVVSVVDAVYVFSEDDDGYLYGWYTYGIEEAETVGLSDILDDRFYDPSDGTGTYLVQTALYGDVLCTEIVTEYEECTEYAYIGIYDGVGYVFVVEYDDGHTEILRLIASSLVTSSAMDRTGEFRDQEAGDYMLTVWFGESADGTRYVYVGEYFIREDGDGNQYYEIYSNGEYYVSGEGELFTEGDDSTADKDATETVSTPYGDIECFQMAEAIDGGTVTYWFATDDEISWKIVYEYDDGSTQTGYILRCTQVEAGPLEDPSSIF